VRELPETDSYNTALHIGAVFIILTCSILGVASVLVGKSCPVLRMSPFFIAIGKTFGTGIVLACALVHMLLPAVESLTGPCVPTSFSEDYPAFPYVFAMLAALAVQTIEMASTFLVPTPKVLSSTCSDDNCAEEVSLPRPAESEGVAVSEGAASSPNTSTSRNIPSCRFSRRSLVSRCTPYLSDLPSRRGAGRTHRSSRCPLLPPVLRGRGAWRSPL